MGDVIAFQIALDFRSRGLGSRPPGSLPLVFLVKIPHSYGSPCLLPGVAFDGFASHPGGCNTLSYLMPQKLG